MVSGPINCVKYLVFIFNLLFFLFGITMVAVGAYVQYQMTDYLNFFDTKINGPAILLIIVGLVIFVIAFFGCCGAIKENYCMVLTFSILMMIILVCQIGGAIAGFVYSNEMKTLAKQQLINSLEEVNEKDDIMRSWNDLQSEFGCCGVEGALDWKTYASESKYATGPPKSCCNTTTECTYNQKPEFTGCVQKVETLLEKNVYYIGAVGMALAVIQVTGVVLSCCLARAVKKEYEVA